MIPRGCTMSLFPVQYQLLKKFAFPSNQFYRRCLGSGMGKGDRVSVRHRRRAAVNCHAMQRVIGVPFTYSNGYSDKINVTCCNCHRSNIQKDVNPLYHCPRCSLDICFYCSVSDIYLRSKPRTVSPAPAPAPAPAPTPTSVIECKPHILSYIKACWCYYFILHSGSYEEL